MEDLPVFGMEMREAWNLGRFTSRTTFGDTTDLILPAATKDSNAEQQDLWLNLNAWTATLVATVQAKGLTSPDFSLYCIWTVRMALEEEGPADVTLEAAAMWFLYASSSIYQLCMAGKTFDGKIAKPGIVFKDREWRGFSQSRWATWIHQMDKARESSSDEKVGKILADAMTAMKAADGASCSRR